MAAVKQHGTALNYADETLTQDKEVVWAAIKKDGAAFQYAHENLKNEVTFISKALEINGHILMYLAENFRQDPKLVLTAVRQNGWALMHAKDDLKKDRNFILEAVEANGNALKYADDSLKKDKAIVLAAINQNPMALKYAAKEIKSEAIVRAIEKVANSTQFSCYKEKVGFWWTPKTPDSVIKVKEIIASARPNSEKVERIQELMETQSKSAQTSIHPNIKNFYNCLLTITNENYAGDPEEELKKFFDLDASTDNKPLSSEDTQSNRPY